MSTVFSVTESSSTFSHHLPPFLSSPKADHKHSTMADTVCSSSSSLSSSYNLKKKPNFTSIILHDLSLLCSLITSHPLYFSYILFFSRYYIKLISFISPLFIATVFLSLLLTTTTAFCPKLPQLQLSIFQTVINQLNSNLNEVNEGENDHNFEDFEIYKIVFHDTLSFSIRSEGDEDIPVTKKILEPSVNCGWRNDVTTSYFDFDESTDTDDELGVKRTLETAVPDRRRNEATITDDKLGVEKSREIAVGRRNEATIIDDKLGVEKTPEVSVHGGRSINVTVTDSYVDELEKEKGFEKLLIELDRFDDFTTTTETNANSDDVIGELRKPKVDPVEFCKCSSDDDKFSQNPVRSSSWRSNSSSVVNIDGSMMLEKEWRKTLACKLIEERHNSRGGEEGMDSLWEAYENDNSKNGKDVMVKNKVMMMKMSSNNGGIQRFEDDDDNDDDDDDDDDEGDEDDNMSSGHLCCLQALKLSTRKMNMGLGKPNFVKISKALKGFGWLHRVKNKHGGKRC